MPIIVPLNRNPLADGRQSERALIVRRGVQRLFSSLGMATLPELPLAGGRRADLVAIGQKGELIIIEIKSSIEDFRADGKWPEYRYHCDRFYFATHPEVPAGIFPDEAGFILSDGHGAEIVREAPRHPLAGATRKALLIRFARASAGRLMAAEIAGVEVPGLPGEIAID
jgi:hypothetical protein